MGMPLILKAGNVSLTSIEFNSADLGVIRQQLEHKQAEAPTLFKNFPCALDLTGFTPQTFALEDVISVCLEFGFLPIAVRNAADLWSDTLLRLQIADLGEHKKLPVQPSRSVHYYQGNVRSGQQVFHDGDLFIFGMVSAGAEVLATGDLHIFGPLRGRALAGVKGNEHALISCQQFNPELISIAGQYRLFEEDNQLNQQPVVVELRHGSLNITGV